jgi:hypothetical protein
MTARGGNSTYSMGGSTINARGGSTTNVRGAHAAYISNLKELLLLIHGAGMVPVRRALPASVLHAATKEYQKCGQGLPLKPSNSPLTGSGR